MILTVLFCFLDLTFFILFFVLCFYSVFIFRSLSCALIVNLSQRLG